MGTIKQTITSEVDLVDFSGEMKLDALPYSLYEGTIKQYSTIGLQVSEKIMRLLSGLIIEYLSKQGLPTQSLVRVDMGFSNAGENIIYELTTGFVDQIGACLSLSERFSRDLVDRGMNVLSRWDIQSSYLTLPPYQAEYDLTMKYLQDARPITDRSESSVCDIIENCYVYGYPLDSMQDRGNFTPGWQGLNAEEKQQQYTLLGNILSENSQLVVPKIFTNDTTLYDELSGDMIFKQTLPKMKGSRNTIVIGKTKLTKKSYEDGSMLAQAYREPFTFDNGKRIEMKCLFLGGELIGSYSLIDSKTQNPIPSQRRIINDSYPQGLCILR